MLRKDTGRVPGASTAKTPYNLPIVRFLSLLALFVLTSLAPPARAEPWLAPGDVGLRHDIQLLADEGVLAAPVMAWPMAWPEVARAVRSVTPEAVAALPEPLAAALSRLSSATDAAEGGRGSEWRVALAEPEPLPTFRDTPREAGELGFSATAETGCWSGRVQVTAVADPADGRSLRLDGSYGTVRLGNAAVTAGLREQWWGPGWEGSLILGSNARPMPSLTVERVMAEPFDTRWLRWLGPWRASASVAQGEGGSTAGDGRITVRPDTKFFAARLSFKPRPWMEVGLSRTAQFCGEGRDCDLGTFWDMLTGRDNTDASLSNAEQPGNQMAGYDLRLRSPWRAVPVAVYGQFIGEDEAGGLPSKFLGLMGAEVWGGSALGSQRFHVEYADTACSFSRQRPQVDCAYRNSVYPQGYTYHGRMIGHALDNDGRMLSFGALLVRPGGDSWNLLLRRVDTNRLGVVPDNAHAVSPSPASVEDIQLGYARGRLRAGVGYVTSGIEASGFHGYLEWRQAL
jgi:hypothetical protein